MPNEAIKPALRAALRAHEIGDRTPYEISFAGKAKSGGSFGFMQGDLAADQPIVHTTFRRCMAAAGMSDAKINDLDRRLSTKGADPTVIFTAEKAAIDAALQASSKLVDAMDEAILGTVYRQLDACIGAAADANRTIAPIAQIYIALWANMSGPPTKILDWLRNTDEDQDLGDTVTEPDMYLYLSVTKYFEEHPENFMHFTESAGVGAMLLPH